MPHPPASRPPRLLGPAVAVLDRMRGRTRAAALLVVILVPCLVAVGVPAVHLDRDVGGSRQARDGLDIVATTAGAMADLAAGTDPDLASVAAALERHPELSEGLSAPSDVAWRQTVRGRVATAKDLDALVAAVVERSELIGSTSGTSLHVAYALADSLPSALVAVTELSAPVPDGLGVPSTRGLQAGGLARTADQITEHVDQAVAGSDDPTGTARDLAPLSEASRELARLSTGVVTQQEPVDGTDTSDTAAAAAAAVGPTAAALDRLLGETTDDLAAARNVAIAVSGLSLAVAVWVSLAVAWRTTTDTREVVAAVRALADGRPEPLPVPLRGDTFGDVGRAVLATRDRLARAHEQLSARETELAALLRTTHARGYMLERLIAVQRALAARRPLQQVLDLVTRSASIVLDDAVLGLVLADPVASDDRRRLVSVFGAIDDRADSTLLAAGAAAVTADASVSLRTRDPGPTLRRDVEARVVAVPVALAGTTTGGLVAILPAAQSPAPDHRDDLLLAFAQQVSLALADARTTEEILEAHHDHLTGLPTRGLFVERLTQAVSDPGTEAALLFIDLDRFKSVNDTMGHEAGDRLLEVVAERLRQCLRSTDSPARLGGDEFAVLLPGASIEVAQVIGQRIIDALRRPFDIDGTPVAIDSSVGVATPRPEAGSTDSDRAAALLSDADIAMYRAKKRGGGHTVVYNPRMREETVERLRVVTDMRQALADSQFSVVYQPLVRLADRSVAAVEALLRWTHPERGPVPPSEFLPIAEETGFLDEVAEWMLRESLRDFSSWVEVAPHLGLNVNVSGLQLADPGFPGQVSAALEAAGVSPDAITLELSESVLVQDPDDVPGRLARLKEVGLRLAVDDFGTGSSALAYLRRLPVDDVKIDRAFVSGLGRDPTDMAVVRTVLDLAATLRLRAVSVGIEQEEQLALLRELGCEIGQGWLTGRPVPAREIVGLLTRSTAPVG